MNPYLEDLSSQIIECVHLVKGSKDYGGFNMPFEYKLTLIDRHTIWIGISANKSNFYTLRKNEKGRRIPGDINSTLYHDYESNVDFLNLLKLLSI